MNLENPLSSGLKFIFSQPKTYEILLVTSFMAFCLTALSFAYTIKQPVATPAYYTLDTSGQLTPAPTTQASDWSSKSDKAVLGEQIERQNSNQ